MLLLPKGPQTFDAVTKEAVSAIDALTAVPAADEVPLVSPGLNNAILACYFLIDIDGNQLPNTI